jgi:endonuclease/exonuclease/phosphatase (EEP) superfamily protein YafD
MQSNGQLTSLGIQSVRQRIGMTARQTTWRRAICAATECVILVAGAMTIAGFAGSMGWLWELTCHFRVQYFWTLALGAVLLGSLGRTRWALAAVVLTLANAAVIAPLYVGPAGQVGSNPPLRMMSLNLYLRNREFDKVLDLVHAERPDVALFLEVTPEWALALRELDDDYPYHRVIPDGFGSAGMAFYSRVQAVSLDFKNAEGMPTMVARLAPESGPLTVIGVHPSSPRSPVALEFRNLDLAVLERLVARQSGPLVVLGDLNTTSWSPYFQDLLRTTSLLDSRCGFGVEGTWPNLPLPFRIPIDHCLVSKDVTVCQRRVGPPVGSDHRAVIVDLTASGK